MKRRRFCQSIAIGSAGFAGTIGRDVALSMSSTSAEAKSRHKWVVLYWMPYDNDLSRFGEPIIEMLTRGTQNTEIAVAVQSDYWGDAKMRRRKIANGEVTEVDVLGKDSSSPSSLATYLNWAKRTFEAKHWAVIVVGHGGKINEVSPDDHEASIQSRTWMKVDQFANVVSDFNQSTKKRVELLFFQNCNKSTLEVVYEAKDCAQYTLASQLTLGAPNYYYEGFLDGLDSLNNGREAAMAIMDFESIEMYHTLTLIDNQAANSISEKLSDLLRKVLDSYLELEGKIAGVPTYHYFGERHCDTLALLKHLVAVSGQGYSELASFSEFFNSELVVAHKTDGELFDGIVRDNIKIEELCGLSIYLPESRRDASRYSSLTLYRETDLESLYRRFIAS